MKRRLLYESAKGPFHKVLSAFSGVRALLRMHAVRAGCFTAISVILVFLVITKSLPSVLASIDPDLALALNPDNPAALIAKGEMLRGQLLTERHPFEKSKAANAELPSPQTSDQTPKREIEPIEERKGDPTSLRMAIRRLALRAIASDPLNAQAFRLLAEATTDYEETRALMQEAVKRSRHEAVALLWLLNDSYYQRDFRGVIDHADMLLRTRPELSSYVFSYLVLAVEAPEGIAILTQEFAKTPPWRLSFFNALPQHIKGAYAPLKLMQAMKESGTPPKNDELAPYLDFLLQKNAVYAAYNAWLQFLTDDEVQALDILNNENFEREPSGLAFDWRISHGINAVAEFTLREQDAERTLHISFGPGRVQFPQVGQNVVLPSGKYRLSGKFKGSIAGRRGLRWQLRCVGGENQVLGETEMLMGKTQEWRVFQFEAEVVSANDCQGQILRLFHDSRSASEELLTGEAWFASLHLEPVPQRALE